MQKTVRRKIASRSVSGATLAFLALPQELAGASVEELAARYIRLSEMKLAGETRVGRHPSDVNNPADIEPNADVREVLDAGLRAIVREMAAVMEELHRCPGGLSSLLSDDP